MVQEKPVQDLKPLAQNELLQHLELKCHSMCLLSRFPSHPCRHGLGILSFLKMKLRQDWCYIIGMGRCPLIMNKFPNWMGGCPRFRNKFPNPVSVCLEGAKWLDEWVLADMHKVPDPSR